MEFSTSLPADLVAVADPSARGPAPLLRPADADGTAAADAMPFADFLALLTAPLPAGESSPLTGKELPPALLVPAMPDATEGVPDGPLPSLPWAPPLATDAAWQARLRLAETPSTGMPTEAAPAKLLRAAAVEPLPLPAAEPASSPAAAEPATAELELLLADASAVETHAPLEAAALESGQAPAEDAAAATAFEALIAQRRLQRPTAVADARLAVAADNTPAATLATSRPGALAGMPAADAPTPQAEQPRIELPKLVSSAVAAGEGTSGVARPEWLPPATPGASTGVHAAAPTGSPATPIDLRAPNGHEAFANRVQWVVDQQLGEARIKLNPPELGAVDVKVSLVDDKTYVQLTAATAAARDELSQSLPRLRELFTVSGLELGGASVHGGSHGHQSGNRGYAADSASPAQPFMDVADGGDEAPVLRARASLGRIDVFA